MDYEAVNGKIDEHDKRLNNHGDRLTKLEKWDEDKHRRLKVVEDNYTKLESTIISENKEMRLFFQSNMDKQWDLIKVRDEQKHDQQKMKHEFDKTKFERWSEILLKLAGTGGILYLIIQSLFNN